MFGQILYTQIKWSRASLAILSVLSFAAPAGLWRAAHGSYYGDYSAMEVMSGFSALGFVLALLAFFAGFVVVAQAWQVDASARHVYALSLPITWRRYVAMRFGAGALLLVVPAVALWLGCLLVLALIQVPDTLNAYPFMLAARFLLGSLVGYAVVFAVQYLSGKRAAHLLLGVLVSVSVLMIAAESMGRADWIARAVRHRSASTRSRTRRAGRASRRRSRRRARSSPHGPSTRRRS
jgi:hypothetical protein